VNGKRLDWAEMVVRVHLRPHFGDRGIARVGTTTIQQYTAKRQSERAANATINHELALLKRAFNLGRIATPPKVTHVPYIPMLREDNVRKGFFEHDAFLGIRGAMTEFWARLAATFACFTGCRRGEILPLGWDQTDLTERVIRLEPGTTKNDQPRVIPLAPELYEMLVMQKAIRDRDYPSCPWVFFQDGQPITCWELRDAWERGCKAAGFVDDGGKPTKLFHDLRRTGVRNLIRAGVPERVAMAISGHRTRAVFDRYNIVSEADVREAGRRLGEYLAHKGTQPEDRHTIGTQADPGRVQ
jgi:integrase